MKDAYEDEPHADAQVAMLIANQAADNDNQVSVEQVRQQLAEEYPLAAVPFDDYVEKSEVLEEAAAPVTVTPARIRRMESRSIRTANGIEVKIPHRAAELRFRAGIPPRSGRQRFPAHQKCDPVSRRRWRFSSLRAGAHRPDVTDHQNSLSPWRSG